MPSMAWSLVPLANAPSLVKSSTCSLIGVLNFTLWKFFLKFKLSLSLWILLSASTLGLLCVLSKLYPTWWLTFTALIALDVVSHWFQTYAKMMEGKTTHKGSDNPLLNFYYTFPYLLICCVGNEGFFICLYVLKFTYVPYSDSIASRIVFSFCSDILIELLGSCLFCFVYQCWPDHGHRWSV
jgi:hypothetical protein